MATAARRPGGEVSGGRRGGGWGKATFDERFGEGVDSSSLLSVFLYWVEPGRLWQLALLLEVAI